jgi:ABC-type polysaccharide/polyol phosphate transport system ATPase subunit
MQSEPIVEVRDIQVNYRSYQERPTSLKETLIKFVKTGNIKYHSTFEALKKVNFSIKQGAVFGIVGSNGAGKSTILKVIAGVLPPTSGEVIVRGSLDCLIQLGAGFDPDLNAIENIHLYGSLRKRPSKELKERVPAILEFAELTSFAHTPIKYYSSGMFARLGFAVAIDSDPDVLIVDEILAVGDLHFREKCEAIFTERIKRGKTIIIVSHDLSTVTKLCTDAVLLAAGEVVYQGAPEEVVRQYLSDDYQTRLK